MKFVPLLIGLGCCVMLACSDKKAKGSGNPIADIKALSLSSMDIISDTLAKQMINAVADSSSKCGNSVANFSAADLSKILDINGVQGIKSVRASYPANYYNAALRGLPVNLLAIDCTNKMCFAMSKTVCPPPDGTSCVNGHIVDETGSVW